MISFGWVLWHINHCRLFNAKSSLYIYIKYIWFGLVGFYGISTIVAYLMPSHLYTYILNIYNLVWLVFMVLGYLMPNPVYTHILIIYMIWKHFVDNDPKFFLWHTFKWFQVFLCNSNNLILVIRLNSYTW